MTDPSDDFAADLPGSAAAADSRHTLAVVGAVTGIPTIMFAASVLAAITMGVGIYTGINLLEAR